VDYRILDLNPAYEAQTGVSRSRVAGKLATEAYAAPEPPFFQQFTQVKSGAKVTSYEAWSPSAAQYLSISIVPVGDMVFGATLTDITPLKRQELELSKSASAMRTMMENQPYLAWLKDKEGRFLAVNSAFAHACGRNAPEDVVGKTDFDVWPQQLAQGYVNDDLEVMYSRTKKIVEEPILNGQETIWFETFKSPIVNDQGEVIGTAGSSRDISERKRAEEERLKLEQQVMQAQKLESLGVLAGGIAHDFNNLLTTILGNTDLALDKLSPVAPAREHVQDIVSASRRAADLCRQMLAYSGKGRFVVQTLSINEIVEEMTHLLSVSISKKAIIKYNLYANLPMVRADATQLRQVVMNLITNASEAIGDRSGVIALTSGAMDCDDQYLKGAVGGSDNRASGQYVYLEVSDTGHGMDQDTLSRIFDPFFTTKFTGRGLGLAAVLGIMRGHKGCIRVHSEPGNGTTFRMLLPVCDQPEETQGHSGAQLGAWNAGGMVLLVDDEETIRSMGRRVLEKGGFTVLTAADGREAVEIFKQRFSEICLVVLDMTMPHLDGEACFRELRRLDPGVRVIITSGYNEQDVIGRFIGVGLAGFVQKPYTGADLLPKIRESLGL
jgi:PAS domain S-box-containing protein